MLISECDEMNNPFHVSHLLPYHTLSCLFTLRICMDRMLILNCVYLQLQWNNFFSWFAALKKKILMDFMLFAYSFWWEILMNDRWDEYNCYFLIFFENIFYDFLLFLSAHELRILKKISSRNWYQKWLPFVTQWNPLSKIH